MKKSSGTGVNVGGASILVIFVLLCLTTFATLSLVSANADQRLSTRTAEATAAYYTADAAAQGKLREIDMQLVTISSDYLTQAQDRMAAIGVDYERDGQSALLFYEEPVDDEHTLQVRLRLSEAGKLELLSWQSVYTGEWEASGSINLWDGGDEMTLMGA